MAIDPVCHMEVDELTALSAEKAGETFYFCCERCRTKFLATDNAAASQASCCHTEPMTVALQPVISTRTGASSKYICPMCAGVESDSPASCPKCGMALEPAAPARAQSQDDLQLPNAPRDRAGPTGIMSKMRDGFGTEVGHG